MRFVEDLRREKVKTLLEEVLNEGRTVLSLKKIRITEEASQSETKVNFKFSELVNKKKKEYSYDSEAGNGFVDCIFNICMKHYQPHYPSLENLRLLNLRIKPDFFSATRASQSDADARVLLDVEIKRYGTSIFECKSRSLIRASSSALLSAFEFYINCEKSFYALQGHLLDAQARNRSDIVASCKLKMSHLTEVNSFATNEA